MEKKLLNFIFLLLFVLCLRLSLFYFQKPQLKEGQQIYLNTTLLQDTNTGLGTQTFSVQDDNGNSFFIKTGLDTIYYYGDSLKIVGNLHIKLLNKNKIFVLDKPSISINQDNQNPALAGLSFIRQKIIRVFQSSLPGNASSLMLGIVFGIKKDFSQNFLTGLKNVGVMHVIAASGMNITIAGGFIFYIFANFLKRQKAILISAIAIVFYAFLAGFQPSVIRASIMAIIAFSAQGLGRQRYSEYALFLTAFIMLIVWPKFLFDVGFQLSFMATLGILILPSILSLGKNNSFLGDLLTTVSAQVFTFPILIANFGVYSLWSVIVNVLVLWTVPILMILGATASIFSFVFEPLAGSILYFCLPLLVYFEETVKYFSSKGGVVAVGNFPWQFSFSYYLFLLSLAVFIYKKRAK